MAECAYCGDTIDGKAVVRNGKKYCTTECADLDVQDDVEGEDEEILDEDDDSGANGEDD